MSTLCSPAESEWLSAKDAALLSLAAHLVLDGAAIEPAAGRAAYRIVQEALTNAAKHALKAQQDLHDDSNTALAHFWKGRAHRKKGEYQKSLEHIVRAREMAATSRLSSCTR